MSDRQAAPIFRRNLPLLRFTREGKYFVGLTLAVGFAAINTGNNLLYLVFGMMLTLIIGSGLLSELTLMLVIPARHLPRRIHAGQPFLVDVSLHNRKRGLASFSLTVQDQIVGREAPHPAFFIKVGPKQTQHSFYEHILRRRGRYELERLQVTSKFPFALFRKYRHYQHREELLVLPAIFPLTTAAAAYRQFGDDFTAHIGRRGEFFALRDYQSGDDPREIHWRKSAQLQRLQVRQYERPASQRFTILLDNYQRGRRISSSEEEAQEAAVSQAASLAAHYLRYGYVVRLLSRNASVGFGSGDAHLQRILTTLALINFVSDDFPPPAAAALQSDETILVRPQASSLAEGN